MPLVMVHRQPAGQVSALGAPAADRALALPSDPCSIFARLIAHGFRWPAHPPGRCCRRQQQRDADRHVAQAVLPRSGAARGRNRGRWPPAFADRGWYFSSALIPADICRRECGLTLPGEDTAKYPAARSSATVPSATRSSSSARFGAMPRASNQPIAQQRAALASDRNATPTPRPVILTGSRNRAGWD